jgi:hypothetical protein
MADDSPLGIPAVDEYPAYTATGTFELRARSVSKRHMKILDDLQTELGDAGRREAIAALCEAYAAAPEVVLDAATPPEFQ